MEDETSFILYLYEQFKILSEAVFTFFKFV